MNEHATNWYEVHEELSTAQVQQAIEQSLWESLWKEENDNLGF
jgi:hypothetical protein